MSSSLLPPLNNDLPLQNGQKAPVNYIKENKLGHRSKFNISRRTRSLARASGRPIAESSVQESHGVYRGNFSFQQTLRVDSSVGNQT